MDKAEIQLRVNTDLEKALNKYAEENYFTPQEAAEKILSSFLIAAGLLKRPLEDDAVIRPGGCLD
ncbi:MAG: hypothetical protein ABFR19_04215 [Pseudomonadota bacterium]